MTLFHPWHCLSSMACLFTTEHSCYASYQVYHLAVCMRTATSTELNAMQIAERHSAVQKHIHIQPKNFLSIYCIVLVTVSYT